ncbi:hypothetical protein DL93DRAFT_2070700 [Clavulina sp. PMI_390]|nr:hypothetical protein DL93DRAFT_2070700 [Clavulina sp. PMI_390]
MLRHSSRHILWRAPFARTPVLARRLADRAPVRHRPVEKNEVEEALPMQPEFRDGVNTVVSFYARFFKYSTIGVFALATTLYVGWEATHQYVEHVELAGTSTDDPYEWGQEAPNWTGSPNGTDPKLGYKGRHAVRAAWMALNWSGEPSLNVIESSVANGEATRGNAYDAQLHKALEYLTTALAITRAKGQRDPSETSNSEEILSSTHLDLLTLSSVTLDRIGTPKSLLLAKPMMKQLYDHHVTTNRISDAARMGVKLGDVSARLGEQDEAEKWWQSSLELLGISPEHLSMSSGKRAALPASPAQQRIAAHALLSLSGYYASSRQFDKAKDVETVGMSLIAHQLMGASASGDRTPAKLLHELFLYHRATIMLMHFGEVTYGQQRASKTSSPPASSSTKSGWSLWSSSKPSAPTPTPVDPLTPVLSALNGAALSAEIIAHTLTSPPSDTTTISSSLRSISTALMRGFHSSSSIPIPPTITSPHQQLSPPTPGTGVDPGFTSSSSSVRKPAEALLRQSKRAAAQALQLRGILLETQGGSTNRDAEALEAYERALAWVGGGVDGRAGADAIESEWKGIWERYVAVREKVLKVENSSAAPGSSE